MARRLILEKASLIGQANPLEIGQWMKKNFENPPPFCPYATFMRYPYKPRKF